MKPVFLKDVKKGTFFTLRPIEEPSESQVFVRGEYDRFEKKFDCYRWSDINDWRLWSGNKVVYVGFTF